MGSNASTGWRAAAAALAAAVLLPCAVGAASAATAAAMDGGDAEGRAAWYAGLAKPYWTPPPRVFPWVWGAMYAAVGAASWLALYPAAPAAPACCYALQLALMAAWSPAFFGLRSPGAALFVMAALLTAAARTQWLFARASPAAGALMAAYVAWLVAAAALNLCVVAASAGSS